MYAEIPERSTSQKLDGYSSKPIQQWRKWFQKALSSINQMRRWERGKCGRIWHSPLSMPKVLQTVPGHSR